MTRFPAPFPPPPQLWRLALAGVIALAALLLYLLVQILLMQQKQIQRTGERVLWDITQAERETLRMQHSLQQWQSGALDNDTMALRYDLWQSRIQLLRDGPQWRNLHAMGLAPLLHDVFSQALAGPARAASAPGTMAMPSPALLEQMSDKLRAASSQVSTTERIEYDQALAHQHQLIRTALLVLLLLTICTLAMLLMLLRQLRQRQRHAALLMEQRRLLQSDIAALQTTHRAHALYRYFVALLSQQMRAPLLEINTHMQRLKHGIQQHPTNFPGQGGQGNDLSPLLERKSRHIREATLRVHNLITSVLSRLRIENGQLRASRLPCSLYVLAQQCCGHIRTLYPGRILHLRIQDADQSEPEGSDVETAASKQPLTLRTYRTTFDVRQARLANLPAFALSADPALLEQLILNVLENACRYTPLDRPIEMSLSSTRNALELRVRDWGQGLSEAQIATLLPSAPDDVEAILASEKGLGLQAALAIAQLHGGTLSVTSAQPQGLCVTLILPR
ncbi:sensor histidine kinase [Vandammella animalimorsus]|uniref:histidine kinase n=1 Tax=Vandammella animalimorsus TaxID=2029117 RepID=A0A2A2AFN3_9BURK|nr:ATP-binding protein [Vandammella animalimorsus]PAT36538.1 hypothetical protein CK625_10635 [Vandammella animalimorsus]